MTTLSDIELLTMKYKSARDLLAGRVQGLQDEIERIKRRAMPGIKKAVAAAKQAESELYAAIESAPELFRKPRTLVLSGIRVGYCKGQGQIRYQDPNQVVKLIHKHFPEQADVLIAVRETPVRKALAQLSAAELKNLGVTLVQTGDQVVIKPTDSEVDKVVNALLKEIDTENENATA